MREPKRARVKVWKTWPVKMLIGMKDLELEERKVNETVDFYFSLGWTPQEGNNSTKQSRQREQALLLWTSLSTTPADRVKSFGNLCVRELQTLLNTVGIKHATYDAPATGVNTRKNTRRGSSNRNRKQSPSDLHWYAAAWIPRYVIVSTIPG